MPLKLRRDTRREVLERFKLVKRNQYGELVFLLEIPIGQPPQDALTLDQKKEQTLNWDDEDKCIDILLDVLRELTGSAKA